MYTYLVFSLITTAVDKTTTFVSNFLLNSCSFWKKFEKNLSKNAFLFLEALFRTNLISLSGWVLIPSIVTHSLEVLKSRLFFEYSFYTPFLFPEPKFPKTSTFETRRRARLSILLTSEPVQEKTDRFITNTPILNSLTPTYLFTERLYDFWNNVFSNLSSYNLKKSLFYQTLTIFRKTIGSGFLYLKGLFLMFFIDACLTDDEPLWEPIEWSLVQSWILFIFLFAWIAENLITSSYGSYTGRDKRVWFSWYKTFWLVEIWYAISLGLAALFVTTPFYHELTYTTPFIVSWWSWYSRVFFCKFITTYSIILYVAYFMQINIRFLHWKKLLYCTLLVNLFLSYLLYIHFFMSFFGYLTDPNWYLKNRLVDYIQLSHEPHRWGWGVTKPVKRDHFLQHRSTSLMWFKNDGPFAATFLFLHIYFFLCLFFLYIFWLTLLRRALATQEFTYTFTVFCVSGLKQFFYFFFLFYVLIFFSFVINYWRTPVENHWLLLTDSWITTFASLVTDLFSLV